MAASTLTPPLTPPVGPSVTPPTHPTVTRIVEAPLRLRSQVGRFAVIGAGCTVLNLALLALLTAPLGAQTANFAGLLISTVVNTAANRAWTFGVHGGGGLARHHVQSLMVFGVSWCASSAALALLALHSAHPSTLATVATVAGANALSTVVRFAAMRSWIFRSPRVAS